MNKVENIFKEEGCMTLNLSGQVDNQTSNARFVSMESVTLSQEIYDKFFDAVESNFKTCHKVCQYEMLLRVPSHMLSQCVKLCSGKTPKTIIRGRIYDEAKKMLANKSLNVKEIMYNLGFDELSTFSRFFKSFEGFSPRKFRENLIVQPV